MARQKRSVGSSSGRTEGLCRIIGWHLDDVGVADRRHILAWICERYNLVTGQRLSENGQEQARREGVVT